MEIKSGKQHDLIGHILTRISKKELIQAIYTALGLKKSAAYSIIEGKTQISYDKMMMLISHLNIPYFDPAPEYNAGAMIWRASKGGEDATGIVFFRKIVPMLVNLARAESRIYYTTYEIPFFYYCYFPELLAFKIFAWYNTAWKDDGTNTSLFDFNKIWTSELEDLSRRCISCYAQIESFEVWTENMFDNTIRQLKYFIKLERFKYISESKVIYNQLEKLIEKLNLMCARGTKQDVENENAGRLVVYDNQIAFSSNIIVTESDNRLNTFIVLDNPNYIYSDDYAFGIHTKCNIEQSAKHAIRLTDNSELVRMTFFNRLRIKLEQVFE